MFFGRVLASKSRSAASPLCSNVNLAFENLLQILCAVELAVKGWEIVQLRDELILQVCKQSIDNSRQ